MLESGNIAWGITATALVMFMTPGLAFFAGGLVKAKSVISMMMMMMMMMSFGALGLISVLWILDGYNISVIANPTDFAGNPFSDLGLAALASNPEANTDLISVSSGATFAIITTALISGAIADRAKFGAWMVFAGLWATLVYFPVAGWLWGGGWIANLGSWLNMPRVIDWAGGTAVEINSGAAGLALGWIIQKTIGFRITNEDEIAGVDSIVHGEEGYAIESV